MINVTYVITTYNRGNYLHITLDYLLNNLQDDEEVVLTDGGSNDCTIDVLKKLKHKYPNKSFNYFSEKDCGEAHGYNKAILNSKGKYIKIVSDDDAYNLNVIRQLVRWLDQNQDVDICGGNGLSIDFHQKKFILKDERQYWDKFKKYGKPFLLTGLSYIIRKESISKLGLFNTSCKIVDFEYSLRVLSNKNIIPAICFLPVYVNIIHSRNNSVKYIDNLILEYVKYNKFYKSIDYLSLLSWKFQMEIYKFKNKIQRKNTNMNTIVTFKDMFLMSIEELNKFGTNNLIVEKFNR